MSYYEKRIAELEARVAQLARDQRMKAIPVETKLLERYALMQADNTRLKAEVERLRKAGDAMYYNILTYKYHIPDNGNTHFMIDASILGWNPKYGQTTEHGEDKEGKQS